MRPITDLRSVEILSARPKVIPASRNLSGSRAAGKAYEKKFGRELSRRYKDVHVGKWLKFQDLRGMGLAQPDFYIPTQNMVVLFECKLSERLEAWDQLDFYGTLLEHLYERPVARIQVCKHLTYTTKPVRRFEDLKDRSVFHWLPL